MIQKLGIERHYSLSNISQAQRYIHINKYLVPLDYRFFPQIHQEICQDCSAKNNLLRVEEALMEI